MNEGEVEWRAEGETQQFEEEGGDLVPEQVRQGREEEMNFMVETLGMYDFGSWRDVESRQGSDHDEMDPLSEEGRRRS